MYLQYLELENFRKYKKLEVNFTEGLNLLIGENDSGKTAIVDAIKYVLGTQSYDYIRPQYEDFYLGDSDEENRSEKFKIQCIFKGLKPKEAAHFLEWLGVDENGYYLKVWLEAIRKGNKVFYEIRAGIDNEGLQLSSEARDYLRTVYLKPLRDAESELSPKKGSRLSQILNSRDEFIDKENHRLKRILKLTNMAIEKYFERYEGKDILEEINNYLLNFSLEANKLNSKFQVSETSLKSILEKLSLKLFNHQISNNTPGLGSHNILYIAAELLLLRKDYTGLKLVLVEELEAHIHPQLQMKLIKEIQNITEEYNIQFIITSHSPNLASKIKLKNIILCKNNNVLPMGKDYTKLEPGDYYFLQRFLDVTKANLFFANGVILVEGDAENILIPTIANLMGKDLSNYGISIVNVGSVAFLRYSKIFLRKDGKDINIPVSIITDVDVKPNENGIYNNELETNRIEKLEEKEKKYTEANIKTFIAPYWTLEYTIALSCLSQIFYKAVYICKKTKNNDYIYEDIDKSRYVEEANEQYKIWEEEGKTKEEIAYEIYKKTLLDKQISKAVVAQIFSQLLSNIDEDLKRQILTDKNLRYLIDAINYVTDWQNDKNN